MLKYNFFCQTCKQLITPSEMDFYSCPNIYPTICGATYHKECKERREKFFFDTCASCQAPLSLTNDISSPSVHPMMVNLLTHKKIIYFSDLTFSTNGEKESILDNVPKFFFTYPISIEFDDGICGPKFIRFTMLYENPSAISYFCRNPLENYLSKFHATWLGKFPCTYTVEDSRFTISFNNEPDLNNKPGLDKLNWILDAIESLYQSYRYQWNSNARKKSLDIVRSQYGLIRPTQTNLFFKDECSDTTNKGFNLLGKRYGVQNLSQTLFSHDEPLTVYFLIVNYYGTEVKSFVTELSPTIIIDMLSGVI